jgi:hypothetical protein
MMMDEVTDPRFGFGRGPNLSSDIQRAAEDWTSRSYTTEVACSDRLLVLSLSRMFDVCTVKVT